MKSTVVLSFKFQLIFRDQLQLDQRQGSTLYFQDLSYLAKRKFSEMEANLVLTLMVC